MHNSSGKVEALNWPKFKVRTGCVTCKIRRIKCDEGKPSCRRCLDTGRRCDGYIKPEDRRTTKKKQDFIVAVPERRVTSRVTTPISDARSISNGLSDAEHLWLQYFSRHAGPALSSLNDRDFWSRMLPQLSLQEPAVRYALLALSSSYANVEAAPKTFGDKKAIGWDSSVRYYNQAISSLQAKFKDGCGETTVPLICCLLFTSLELLYEDRRLMLSHLESGLKILDSLRIRSEDGAFFATLKHKLQQIFRRLEGQSTFYGKPVASLRIIPFRITDSPMSKEPFSDIIEAKMEIDRVMPTTLNFIRAVGAGTFQGSCPGVTALQFQGHLQEQIMNWRLRLDKLQDTWSAVQDENVKIATVLRIQQIAGFIYLSNCLEECESSYEAYKSHFAALLKLAHSLARYIDRSPPECRTPDTFSISTPFSLEFSLLPPLYLIALKCRDPQLRRQAIHLMRSHPGREGLFHPDIHWRVGQRVMKIEEAEFRERAPQARRAWVLGADIQRDASVGIRHASVGYSVCFEDELGRKEWSQWTEDLWF